MQIENIAPQALHPYARNARTHSRKQLNQLMASIKRFGFTNPILVAEDLTILAGHGRVEAAKLLKLDSVPIIRFDHMSEEEKRAYVLADNKLALNAGWDREMLATELQGLIDLGFEMELTGFEPAEIDLTLSLAADAYPEEKTGPEDDTPLPGTIAVSKLGDVWELGRHRLICTDARDHSAYAKLMPSEAADVMFTDPPYNVRVDGHVRTGAGHREFAMASGEMSEAAFTAFLRETLEPAAKSCRDGAIAFVCMDWRHMRELLDAGHGVFTELKNVCVWTKSNGGMGSLYRSQHELVFVFKCGSAAHSNHVELGRHGRNRTNVWAFAGVNSFKAGRDEELELHPTVKPTALVEEALKDVTKRGDLVLDPFGGSGSTLIAAERCGRSARLIEIDPLYCDVIVRRYQQYSGKPARRASDGVCFDDAAERVGCALEVAHGR
jgi:DNA modification methylase